MLSLSIFTAYAFAPYDKSFFGFTDMFRVSAESYGAFGYAVSGSSITITDCDESVTLAEIPAEIDGLPVVAIADSAFDGCKKLTSVIIPDGITEIGNYAFKNCISLSAVTLPESVTILRYSVFYGCTGLSSVKLPASLSSVGNYMFYGCKGLSAVSIPNSVRDIGAYAFYGCTGLRGIGFGSGLRSVGERAFAGCTAVESVTLPSGSTKVGAWAFAGCTSLESIVLADTVTEIGKYAFEGCTAISSVKLPESLLIIGESAFRETSVSSVTLPDSVTSLGAYAFYGCTSLGSFTAGKGLTAIGDYTFFGCTTLGTVNLGENVTKIGASAFRGCTVLREIELPTSATVLGEYAFCGCSNLAGISFGSIESVGNYAFYGCTAISEITLPESVLSIGDYAFYGCVALRALNMPDTLLSIGERAFQGCKGITEPVLPGKLETIDDYAFYDCSGLTGITIPAAVKSVGNMAFYGCIGITSAKIFTESAQYGNLIFYDCNKLAMIYGFPGSTIQSYAAKSALPFTAVDFISVTISSPAVKTNYYTGDTLNTSGLKLAAVLRNGETIEINGGYTVDYDFSTEGTKTVSVSFGGYTCTYDVNVEKVSIIRLEPVGYTIADSYYAGDSVPYSKISALKVIYSNGKETSVTTNWSLSTSLKTPGTGEIMLSYGGFRQYFTVTVLEISVASLEIITQPAKTQYFINDEIDLSGMVVRVKFNSGSTTDITTGWSFDGSTNTSGTRTVTVKYGGRSTTLTITVNLVKGQEISVISMPVQTTYYSGTQLVEDGLVLSLLYNNGTTEEITSGWTLKYSFSQAGSSPVTVIYKGLTTTFDVNVVEDLLIGLSINTPPEKTTYYLGEALDLAGLTLNARFKSGAMTIVSNGWTVDGTLASTGTKTISVRYGGRTVTMDVTVLANFIKSISVQTLPVKTEYNSGDSLNTAGLTLLATYASESTAVITGGWTTEYDFGAEGTRQVKVTYAGCSTTFNVNVKFTYKDNSFIFSQDNWSFINTVGVFGSGSYYLSDSDYNSLMSQLSNTEKTTVQNSIKSGWGGSCYGMTSVALLAKIGILKPSQWQAGTQYIYQFDKPANNSVESLINYYQWLQYSKAAGQQKIVYAQLENSDKIKDMVRMASAVPNGGYPFLINFQHAGYDESGEWESWGHAIIGYGVAYGSWTYNGRAYNARILAYDPNCSGFMPSACLYFDTATYDWIIPMKNTYYTAGDSLSNGLITLATNNISIINYAGLCDGNQNYTVDCYVSVLGTTWLDAFTLKRISVSPGPGVYYGANADEDVTILYDMFADGQNANKMNMVLADSESGYILRTDKQELLLDMNYEHSLLLLDAASATEAAFKPDGEISFKGENSNYSMKMVFDEGYYDFPWYEIKVSGQGVNNATLSRCEEGYLLSADNLKNVCVAANGNNPAAQLTFSANYTSVAIIAINEKALGVYADTDGNGTYETLVLDTLGNSELSESAVLTGDIYIDGKVNANDLTMLAKYVAKMIKLSDEQLANADCYKDGVVDSKDLTKLAKYNAKLIKTLE